MRKPSAPLLAVVGLLAALATAGRAQAQRGVDSELFHPALDSYGIFTVDRAQTSRQWDWGFRLFLNYAQNPLRLNMCPLAGSCATTMPARPPLSAVMGYQVALNFGIHLGLTNWLELTLDFPILIGATVLLFLLTIIRM